VHNKLKKVFIATASILVICLFLFYYFYNPTEYSIFPRCPFNRITGLFCPGCGSQRAIHQILHANFTKGISHNFLIGLAVLVIVYDALIYLMNKVLNKSFKNILHYSKTTYTILILIILFWVLRNIDQYPFTILAP